VGQDSVPGPDPGASGGVDAGSQVHPRTRSPYVEGLAQTALALAIPAGFAIAHANPYLHLLIWVNTPGVFEILLLQVAAAISVLTSFRRTPYDEGAWRTVIAPVLAAVGAVVLAAQHAELLNAASPTVLMLHPGHGRAWRGVGPGAAHQQGGHARGLLLVPRRTRVGPSRVLTTRGRSERSRNHAVQVGGWRAHEEDGMRHPRATSHTSVR
jgi:hypothetical protein